MVGTPLVVALLALAFSKAGATSLFAAVGSVLTAGLLLPNLLAPLGLPVLAWPVVLGLIAAGYVLLEQRAASGASD